MSSGEVGMDGAVGTTKRWGFRASIAEFLQADPNAILGALTNNSWAGVETTDAYAWREEVVVLQRELLGFEGRGHIYFECEIPRLGRRIDVLALVDHVLFVLEFKVGATTYASSAIAQAWDYALDLKYFQSACADAPIVPILVATECTVSIGGLPTFSADGVAAPLRCNAHGVRAAILAGLSAASGPPLKATEFEQGRYQPTPTIVEAARALYANHSVEDITRHDAGAKNLAITGGRVNDIIAQSKLLKQKSIVFVTGVPGAGKTLVGLDGAGSKFRRTRGQGRHTPSRPAGVPFPA